MAKNYLLLGAARQGQQLLGTLDVSPSQGILPLGTGSYSSQPLAWDQQEEEKDKIGLWGVCVREREYSRDERIKHSLGWDQTGSFAPAPALAHPLCPITAAGRPLRDTRPLCSLPNLPQLPQAAPAALYRLERVGREEEGGVGDRQFSHRDFLPPLRSTTAAATSFS